ncbi:hypothetical protein [Haloarcula halophila]|uniref:hypothetical protein n=1 Tax=Haloarcula TaxID=2237 RepID=UPI0023E3D496|nr:hypothetical protein [Halomicroarcula sp. DFY41]
MDPAMPDYERFERRQIAQDRDRQRPDTVEIDEQRARDIVQRLADQGTVSFIPGAGVICHDPSGKLFESNTALACFHKGWMAAETE